MRRRLVAAGACFLILSASPAVGSPIGAHIQDAAVPSEATPKRDDGAKKPPTWQTFKANRIKEAAPTRLMIPKVLPAVIDDARDTYAEWQEAWSNHLEYKKQAENLNQVPATSSSPGSDPVSLYVTGPYAIPTYIVMCESGGNYLAENDYSTASGAYQIIDSSWTGYGGYYHASDAPPAVQDAKAALMWAGGAGASHWAACL